MRKNEMLISPKTEKDILFDDLNHLLDHEDD